MSVAPFRLRRSGATSIQRERKGLRSTMHVGLLSAVTDSPELTEENLGQALRVDRDATAFIDDLHMTAKGFVATQEAARVRLEAKASGQVTASSLSLTATLVTLGAAGRHLGSYLEYLISAIAVAALFGIVSTTLAARALAIGHYKIPSIEALFGARLRALVLPAEGDTELSETEIRSEWRLSATLHLIQTAQINERLFTPRAKLLEYAQAAYLGFLFFAALSVIILICAASTNQ